MIREFKKDDGYYIYRDLENCEYIDLCCGVISKIFNVKSDKITVKVTSKKHYKSKPFYFKFGISSFRYSFVNKKRPQGILFGVGSLLKKHFVINEDKVNTLYVSIKEKR